MTDGGKLSNLSIFKITSPIKKKNDKTGEADTSKA